MEPAKVEESASKESSAVIEMGRVSVETKGMNIPVFESFIQPSSHN
jgi:hypothetical protein